jgi:hypothetical protein
LKSIWHPRILQYISEVSAGANAYAITEFIPRSVAEVIAKKVLAAAYGSFVPVRE